MTPLGLKLRGTNRGGGRICGGAGGWGGRRSSAIMSSSDVRGLSGVGTMSAGVSPLSLSHLSLRCLIVVAMSEPESNSDSCSGLGTLARLCASASLLIRSSSRCSLSMSPVLSGSGGQRSQSSGDSAHEARGTALVELIQHIVRRQLAVLQGISLDLNAI